MESCYLFGPIALVETWSYDAVRIWVNSRKTYWKIYSSHPLYDQFIVLRYNSHTVKFSLRTWKSALFLKNIFIFRMKVFLKNCFTDRGYWSLMHTVKENLHLLAQFPSLLCSSKIAVIQVYKTDIFWFWHWVLKEKVQVISWSRDWLSICHGGKRWMVYLTRRFPGGNWWKCKRWDTEYSHFF